MIQLPLIKQQQYLMPAMSIYRAGNRLATPYDILQVVSLVTRASVSDIKGDSRKEEIVLPRFYACYFLYQYCNVSKSAIKRYLKYDNHTSVMHAIKEVNNWIHIRDSRMLPTIENINNILSKTYSVIERKNK
jgi:chromosomal replication initiation ATPase DnaA